MYLKLRNAGSSSSIASISVLFKNDLEYLSHQRTPMTYLMNLIRLLVEHHLRCFEKKANPEVPPYISN